MEKIVKINDLIRDDNGLIQVTTIVDDNTFEGEILTRLPDDIFANVLIRKIKKDDITGHTSPIITIKDKRLKRYKNNIEFGH